MHSNGVGRRQLGHGANKNKFLNLNWVALAFLVSSYNSFSSLRSISYYYGGGGNNEQLLHSNQLNLPPEMNVAFGLSGNHPGFLLEFETALKSVLLNAPLERELHIHVLADKAAYDSLPGIFNRTDLATWVTRNPISIHAYNITPDLPWLEQMNNDTFTKRWIPTFKSNTRQMRIQSVVSFVSWRIASLATTSSICFTWTPTS